jgi:hypothetical protein
VNKTGDRTTAASFTLSNPSGFSARSSDSGFSGQLIESTNPSQSETSKSDDKNSDPIPRGIPAMAEPTKLTYLSAQTKAWPVKEGSEGDANKSGGKSGKK